MLVLLTRKLHKDLLLKKPLQISCFNILESNLHILTLVTTLSLTDLSLSSICVCHQISRPSYSRECFIGKSAHALPVQLAQPDANPMLCTPGQDTTEPGWMGSGEGTRLVSHLLVGTELSSLLLMVWEQSESVSLQKAPHTQPWLLL